MSSHPDVTWRDAVTPLSRASRRRWALAYGLLLALAFASVADAGGTFAVGAGDGVPLVLVVALAVVFGMLRRGTRRIAALDHPDLDERDIAARNAAYRVAFPWFVAVVVATLVLLVLALPDQSRTATLGHNSFEVKDGWFIGAEALLGLGLWLVLWAVYLPTGVLAWREPDALESGPAPGGLSEAVRDALLGLALGGAILISLVADDNSGVALFIAALALLGALARHAAGQPVMSRARRLRVAIGVAMILVVVAIGLFGLAAGGSENAGRVQTVRVR